jgi:hypothetical protein
VAFDRSARYSAADAVADVNVELGRAYVAPGSEGEPSILDAERLARLAAWADTLIPGDGEWPRATEVPVVPYIDRTLALAARLRPTVLRALDEVQAEALSRFGEDFGALSAADRVSVLRWYETDAPLTFTLLKELTYEAYYRDPKVAVVIKRRTGFDTRLPVDGTEMPTDKKIIELLGEVAEKPSLVRSASA